MAGLLDVNALVALAWDSHIHHATITHWFLAHSSRGWATCPVTESGFVRISSNARLLPAAIAVEDARRVLAALRAHAHHEFVSDDVSMTDPDVPRLHGHRQVTDAHLLALARRRGHHLVTFDTGLQHLASGQDVELLTGL